MTGASTPSIPHSVRVRIGYRAETAYAAGIGSTELALTAPTAASQLTVFNSILEDATVKRETPLMVNEQLVGDGANDWNAFFQGIENGELTFPVYVQNDVWLKAAIDADAGEVPGSYLLHIEFDDYSWDFFGCYLTTYKHTVTISEKPEWPKEELTFKFYKSIKGLILRTATPALASTSRVQPKTVYNSSYSITVGATTTSIFPKEGTLTIENTLTDEGEATSHFRLIPQMESRKVTVELTMRRDYAQRRFRDQVWGYQELGLTGKSLTDIAIATAGTYNYKINDVSHSITTTGTNATWTEVLALLNVTGDGLIWALENGDVRAYGTGNFVSLAAGATSDLFTAIAGFSALETALIGPPLDTIAVGTGWNTLTVTNLQLKPSENNTIVKFGHSDLKLKYESAGACSLTTAT